MSRVVASLIILITLLFPTLVQAQTKGIEVTQEYKIDDSAAVEGDIISSTSEGLVRSKVTADNKILGILQPRPLVVFRSSGEGFGAVVRTGTAYVNVTNINGAIKRGDFVTSSTIPGKGQKALENGYVIGIANANFDESKAAKISFNGKSYASGQIPVDIRIENAEIGQVSLSRALDIVVSEVVKSVANPGQIGQFAKYTAALLIFLASLLFAFVAFFRVVTKGIEALGRNPLARTSIQLSIILNIALVIAICIVGLIAAIVIVRF